MRSEPQVVTAQRSSSRGAAALRPVLLALALGALLSACGEPPAHEMPPQGVSVARVEQREISDRDVLVGRIEAVDTVEVRPRVNGHLREVHFEEGELVKAGDPLFSIDDREYAAAVAAARADVARADSRVALAREEQRRSEALIEARAVSQGELELRQADLRQADADLAAARARLAQADLQLGFTRISSPIDGRVSAARVRPGNLVSAGEPVLTTVVSVDPIRVSFDADERALLRYRGNGTDVSSAKLAVDIGNADRFEFEGRLNFIDNALDPRTGTVRMRGELANPQGTLVPGLSARVRLDSGKARTALLVHEQAIQTDQDRKYVWVLGEGNTAMRRDVAVGTGIDGLRVVESGLTAEDQVIVNGMRKIFFPGQPVAPVEVPMTDPLKASAQADAAGHGG